MHNNKKAFTLIELLVVVLIIVILATVALPQYRLMIEKNKLSKIISNIRTIKDGLELIYLETGGAILL
jgi:prepilin-type N-terminal cleavage/methylation domain-containing protein